MEVIGEILAEEDNIRFNQAVFTVRATSNFLNMK
jgi:hypothetical protein